MNPVLNTESVRAVRSSRPGLRRGPLIALAAAAATLAGAAEAEVSVKEVSVKVVRSIGDAYLYDAEAAEESAAAAAGIMTAAEKQAALDLINAARSRSRRCGSRSYPAAAPVKWNPLLEQAAQRHSDDMASRGFFSHTGPGGSTPATRISAAGYNWYTLGENIAAGYSSAPSVISGWLKSPGHCANLMNSRFKDIGLARQVNAGSRYGTYWTLDLAAPR